MCFSFLFLTIFSPNESLTQVGLKSGEPKFDSQLTRLTTHEEKSKEKFSNETVKHHKFSESRQLFGFSERVNKTRKIHKMMVTWSIW